MLDYIPHNRKPDNQDGCLQTGSTYNSACILERNAMLTATLTFSGSSNSMGLLQILSDIIGSRKSNMAAVKPEVVITQCTKEIGRRFRRLRLGFAGRRDQRNIDQQRIMLAWHRIQHGDLQVITTSGLKAAIFDLRHAVTYGNIQNSSIEYLDSENVGVAVKIALLSS